MATIVRTGDGRYFEIDEKTLKKYRIKAESVPPGKRIPDQAGAASPVQIIIRVPAGATVVSGSEVGGRMQWPPHGEDYGRGDYHPPTCGVRG